jgi:hypothetical protein
MSGSRGDLVESASSSDAETKAARVRELNDRFRTTLIGGNATMTSGIAALGETMVARIIETVCKFANFDADNDPHHEHDFGAFEIEGHKIFFKIDCYDKKLEFGSPDPADPSVKTRVLTIMLAEEY